MSRRARAAARDVAQDGTVVTSKGRRPLPALALIVALAVLTAVVWWRVLHRPQAPTAAASTPASCASAPTVLPRPATVAVTVLNGAGKAGLAGSVGATLRQRGFQVGRIDNAPQAYPGTARIAYGTGQRSAATLVGFYLPGAELVDVASEDRTLTITLGAKFTAVAAPDAVQRAINQAHAVVGSPAPASTSAHAAAC